MEETTDRKGEKIAVLVSIIPILRELGFPEDPADILQEGARLCDEVDDQRSMAIIRGYASMSFAYRGDAVMVAISWRSPAGRPRKGETMRHSDPSFRV